LPEPDPATSREVRFEMTKPSGNRSWFKLVWSLDEIEAAGATVGSTVDFNMPELGIIGPARCTYIGLCPEFKEGDGNLVIGVFKHEPDGPIVNVHIEGLEKPIGSTANHPFWSEDWQDYVAAGDLQQGEQVWSELRGTIRVKSVTPAPDVKYVYNLTVHNQHVYEVSELGVVVHNSCPTRGAVQEAIENGTLSTRRLRNNSQIHHIASDKDKIFGPQFEKLFKEGGLDLQSTWNKTRVPGHVGPHGKFYNNYVLERLQTAVAGKSGNAYRKGLLDELYQLRREIQIGDLGDLLRAAG
ncbi:MAG: AHH domain-containing protein, partial [Planctomycetes bacterium]|nr:AHH domain-containing protein [Planctomycetota bacterium]